MKRVVIVGGGVAGLSAASSLVRMGCTVTLLEAKDHFGGRIHTVADGGIPIELGAEFLHGDNQTITNAIRAAGLSTHPIADHYQIFHDGQSKRVNFIKDMNKLIHHVDIRREDCSFEDFLDHQDLVYREEAINFVEGFHAADLQAVSAQSLRLGEHAAEPMKNTTQSRINEGYGALVNFLVQEIRAHGGKLVTKAGVKKISWQPGFVAVTFRHTHRDIVIEADAAVITLPLGVLKAGTVEFVPALSDKHEAIEKIQFGNVVKAIFEFSQAWWPDFGFIIAPDEVFPTWWTDPRGPVLTAWAGGPKADLLLKQTPPQLEQLGLKTLAMLFPAQAATINEQFLSMRTFDWAHDPCTLGAYSYLPVNGLNLPKLLGVPVADTLFFAGEATVTDARPGTVLGAFETGLRAGREFLASIVDTMPEAVMPLQK